MKRILITCVVLMIGAVVAEAKSPWAELTESVDVREGRVPQSQVHHSAEQERAEQLHEQIPSNMPMKVSVLPRVLAGKPIRVSVYPPSAVDDKERHDIAEKLVRLAYMDWFANAVEYIEYEKRQEEFKDVLPILKKQVPIEFVEFAAVYPGEIPVEDVWVAINDTLAKTQEACGCTECLGCEFPGSEKHPMAVFVSADGSYSTVVHEIGHTLGLADAYEEGYQKNASQTHRSKERMPVSVMNVGDNELSGDDADGLINMIDSWTIYFLKKKYPKDWCNHVSARVRNGWDSLLKYKTGGSFDRYAMGTAVSLLPQNRACGPIKPKPVVKQQPKRTNSSVNRKRKP